MSCMTDHLRKCYYYAMGGERCIRFDPDISLKWKLLDIVNICLKTRKPPHESVDNMIALILLHCFMFIFLIALDCQGQTEG